MNQWIFFLRIDTFEEVEPFIVGYITTSSRCNGGCTNSGHWCDRVSVVFQETRLEPTALKFTGP